MTMSSENLRYLDVAGRRIAYRLRPGSSPTLIFLPGYASDMEGTKALALDAFAARDGRALVRFDYSGTGSSPGRFEDGTLAHWLEEGLEVVDQLSEGPVILIGSSMGGWLALLIAARRPERVAALIGIAAAPDFTNWGFTADQKRLIQRDGELRQAGRNPEDSPLITKAFWQSGERLRILDSSIPVDCPVRLIHGEKDRDVPVDVAMRLLRQLRSADVQLNIIKDGGHRLSEPQEIDTILRTVKALLEPS